jgi:hypothetical protein
LGTYGELGKVITESFKMAVTLIETQCVGEEGIGSSAVWAGNLVLRQDVGFFVAKRS